MEMEIELVREQNGNYVRIRTEEGALHAHERGMLSYNRVPCILPVNMRYVDEMVYVEYALHGMKSLSEVFARRRMAREEIVRLVGALCSAQEALFEYMLSPDGLILEPAYVFMDAAENAVQFCYQPGARARAEENAQVLLRYILDHVDYHDQEAVALAYALYHQEDSGGNIFRTLKAYIEKTAVREKESPGEEALKEHPHEEHAYTQEECRSLIGRLLHRRNKRALLMEHAAAFEKQEREALTGQAEECAE